jgi:hypothetical protein
MRPLSFLLILGILGCGGGGSSSSGGNITAPLTTQQVLEQCLAADLADLSTLIGTVQGLLNSGGTGPQPKFDLVSALLTGILPWTLDVDGDMVNDLTGTIYLTDAGGSVTLPPPSVITLFTSGTPDLNAILALLPDGTHMNLTFDFNDLGIAHGATGGGNFAVEVQGGVASSVSGGGTFDSGGCSFEFSFDGLGTEILDGSGFGSGTVDFDVGVGTETVSGSIVLDGTNVAQVTATQAGGAPEHFLVDLTTGAVTPAPP